MIRVGNVYTGYTAFRLTTQTGSQLDPMLLLGIGMGVTVIAIVLVVYRIRAR